MLFSSITFLFLFLPIMLAVYYIAPPQWKNLLLLAGSLIFYAWGEPVYIILMILSILLNYFCGMDIENKSENEAKAKRSLVFAITVNIVLLVFFKYFGFLVESTNTLFGISIPYRELALPIGISFYTFQEISYIVDVYRGKVKAQQSLVKYALYVSMFPQLVAGPIVCYGDIEKQLTARKISGRKLGQGAMLFIIGLSKKAVLANTLGKIFEEISSTSASNLTVLMAWLGCITYAFQIYFDFSGYSDMAIGLGKMFNIELPINFNSPYKACSVKELWQRWHMTLSRFFIQYVYIPLGGSRKGKARTIFNTFMVFFLSGLWHGANWTYIAWGSMQGLLVIWDNLGIVGVKGSNEKMPAKWYIPRWLGWIFTFGFFNLSLIFFGSSSMTSAIQLFKNIFAFKNTGYLFKLAANLDIPEFYLIKQVLTLKFPDMLQYAYVVLFLLLLVISAVVISRKNTLQMVAENPFRKKLCAWVVFIFVWSVISFSQVSTFIYFNF